MTNLSIAPHRLIAVLAVLVSVTLALGARVWTPAAPSSGARAVNTARHAIRDHSELGARTPARQSIRFDLDTVRTRIGFYAQATAGPFEGSAERYRGYAEVTDTVQFAQVTGRVEIDVASFRTGIGLRDRHLRGEMGADEYPTIVYELTRIDRSDEPLPAEAGLSIPEDEPERSPVLIYGKLTVRGVTRDVGSYALARLTPDSAYVLGRVPIRFTDFEMEPPTRMLGLTRVDDRIVLFFDAVLAAVSPPREERSGGRSTRTRISDR